VPYSVGDHVRLTRATPVSGESLISFEAGDEGVVVTAGDSGCVVRIHGMIVLVAHSGLERLGAVDPASTVAIVRIASSRADAPAPDPSRLDTDLDLSFLD